MVQRAKLRLWFGRTYPRSLWCGNKYIIMAARIPTQQSVTVGSKRHHWAAKPFQALPKSNCLMDSPFVLRHLTVCSKVLSLRYK